MGAGRRVVGVALLGIATSVPEAAAAFAGIREKKGELVFGMLLGSCTINLALGFGIPALVAGDGISLTDGFLRADLPFLVLVGVSCLLPALAKSPLDRVAGALLAACYIVFLWSVITGREPLLYVGPILIGLLLVGLLLTIQRRRARSTA